MMSRCKGVGERNGKRLFFKVGGAVACVLCMLLSGSSVMAAGEENWTVKRPMEGCYSYSPLYPYGSIAMDGNGNPGVAYHSSNGVKFAFMTDGSWNNQTVDSNVADGGIGLAWDGSTWVMAYGGLKGQSYGQLKYAKRDPTTGSWSIQTLENANVYTTVKGIAAFNANGKYRIGISYQYNNDLRYAEYDGSAWTKTTIQKNVAAIYNSVDFDSSGEPAMAYSNMKPKDNYLQYAKRAAGKWTITTVASGAKHYGIYVDLDLSSNNNPYIVCADGYLFSNTGSGWTSEQVDANANWTSIALDESGGTVVPYISYADKSRLIQVAKKVNGAWTAECADADVGTALLSALQIFWEKDASNNIITKKLGLGYGVILDLDGAPNRGYAYAERNLLDPSTWG